MSNSTYESGYDAKYGYNRNAFAHHTPGTKLMSYVVKGIAMPIGLVSEAIHDYKDNKKSKSKDQEAQSGDAGAANHHHQQMAYLTVPEDQANELIASGQAVPAEGHEPTHELVPADSNSDEASGANDIDRDEADWELDEVSGPQESNETSADVQVDDLIQAVQASSQKSKSKTASSSSPPTGTDVPSNQLPYPVIIPQRRPGTKTRGFVRAYAPALSDRGVDEATFIAFLNSLHRAAQSSPVLQVLQLGTAAMSLYPDPVIGAAIQAAQVAVAIAQEIQERWQTNRFLERANREIFTPRGLFAMIVTYKSANGQLEGDNSDELIQTRTVDLAAQAVAKYGGPAPRAIDQADGADVGASAGDAGDVGMREKLQNRLRLGDGTTLGEAQMPLECAPLIFPALEQAAMLTRLDGTNETLAKWQQSGRGAARWMDDYFDRRAQAKFAFSNPDSKLVKNSSADPAGDREFKSRFADPNNAVNTHFFTLVTGGRFKAEPLGAHRRWEKNKRREAAARGNGLKKIAAKRLLGEDVLYLQIVNMPSEEQLARARQEIAEKKKSK